MNVSLRVERRLPLAAALFGAALVWRLLAFTGFNNDHYAHLALAQQMLLGDLPVRDFSDPGWPLTYLVSAAAWRFAGSRMWVEWAVTSVAFGLGAAFTVQAARRMSGSMIIAVLVAAVEILISPRTYAYPKILPYAAFACVIASGAALSIRRLALLGVVIATAFLLRHDHGIWIGLAAAVYVALASREDGWPALVRRGAIVLATTAAVLLPWLLFIVMNGGVIPYFTTALEFARAEANASTLRAWPRFGAGVNAEAWLFWLYWALPGAAAVVAARRWRRGDERRPGELRVVAALVILAIGVNAGFLRDLLRTRFADAIVPAAVLGAWLLGAAYTTPWRRRIAQRVAQATAVAVIAVSLAAMAQATEVSDRFERANVTGGLTAMYGRAVENAAILGLPHRQAVMPPSRVAAAMLPFFSYMDRCTPEDDRLIVTGEYPDIVVLSGRAFAGDGVVFGAWYSSAANQDRTLRRLLDRPAIFVVLLDETGFRRRFNVIARYVDAEYRPFARMEAPGIDVPILVHAGRAPTRVDADSGWACFR